MPTIPRPTMFAAVVTWTAAALSAPAAPGAFSGPVVAISDGATITVLHERSRRSHVFPAPDCRNAAALSPSNRVAFDPAAAAETAGYRPGQDCHPR